MLYGDLKKINQTVYYKTYVNSKYYNSTQHLSPSPSSHWASVIDLKHAWMQTIGTVKERTREISQEMKDPNLAWAHNIIKKMSQSWHNTCQNLVGLGLRFSNTVIACVFISCTDGNKLASSGCNYIFPAITVLMKYTVQELYWLIQWAWTYTWEKSAQHFVGCSGQFSDV